MSFFLGFGILLAQILAESGCDENRSGADECFHYTSFINILENKQNYCERHIKWANWIHLPNYFGDSTLDEIYDRFEDFEEISQGRKYAENFTNLYCALLFPSCESSRCLNTGQKPGPLFKAVYHKSIMDCFTFTDITPLNKNELDLLKPTETTEDSDEKPFQCRHLVKLFDFTNNRPLDSVKFTEERCPTGNTEKIYNIKQFSSWSNTLYHLRCIKERIADDVTMNIYKIGETIEHREMIAVEVSEIMYDRWYDTPIPEPEVRLMGNIHGNEDQGIFILIPLINEMATSTDPDIVLLRQQMKLHILISANPDGYMLARRIAKKNNNRVGWLVGRQNMNKIDLNRNFPYLTEDIIDARKNNRMLRGVGNYTHIDVPDSYYKRGNPQIETINIIKWTENHNFVLSAMLHSGAWVFNYPYDTSLNHPNPGVHDNEDKPAFFKMAQDFVAIHPWMAKHPTCHSSDHFKIAGVTNGADWYSLKGSLQDYGYISRGVAEITLELGCDKTVHIAQTSSTYKYHRNAFLNFLWHVLMGIHGEVTSSETYDPIVGAEVFIRECKRCKINPVSVLSDKYGKFYKLYYPVNPEVTHVQVIISHKDYKTKYSWKKVGWIRDAFKSPLNPQLLQEKHERNPFSFEMDPI